LTIISVCLIGIVDTFCVHILVIPLHILKTVSLTISHHTVSDFCSFSPAAPAAGLAAFVGTTVAPVGATIANLLLQAEISQNSNLVVKSKWIQAQGA
jgi:hypothetical protein